MKKLLILSIAVFTLFSCSSDDDNLDPIVGSWNLFSVVGTEVSDCEKMSTVTFNSNETATGTTYKENPNNNNNCETVGVSDIVTWENSGNGVYKIISSSNTQEWSIIFSNNNNTFTITNHNVVYKRQ